MTKKIRDYAPIIGADGRKEWYWDCEARTNFLKEVNPEDVVDSTFCLECTMTQKCVDGMCGHAMGINVDGLSRFIDEDFDSKIIICKF